MIGRFRILFAAALTSLFAFQHAYAQEQNSEEMMESWQSVTSRVSNETFIWFKEKRSVDQLNSFGLQITKDLDVGGSDENRGFGVFENLNGIAVSAPLNTTRFAAVKTQKFLGEGEIIVEPNSLIFPFVGDCDDDSAISFAAIADGTVPSGVMRIGGPLATVPSSTKVWILDSGIDSSFDSNYLNVNRTDSLECRFRKSIGTAVCKDGANGGTAVRDLIGHGTMIAGIIGGKQKLLGVAPGVELVPIQIFKNSPITDLFVAYKALDVIKVKVKPGDVINISWGADWNPHPQSRQRKIEDVLREFADAGVRVAIAAGNKDELQKHSGYVQMVSPARAGYYRPSGIGAIVSVSASTSLNVLGSWVDVFWSGSAFGNGDPPNFNGPPDFAEPGDGILSLWPAKGTTKKANTCSGTSFAAAHASGILVKGIPKASTSGAVGDPSASYYDPSSGAVVQVPSQQDKIGLLP